MEYEESEEERRAREEKERRTREEHLQEGRFGGTKDADRLMFRAMSQEEFLYFCVENHHRHRCGEHIFEARLHKDYPNLFDKKPANRTWKDFYLIAVHRHMKEKETNRLTH